MYIEIDHSSTICAYMQIYQELRSRIISGAFVYGAKLPSKRVLAKECLVSIITVEHAYQLLCDEGYCRMKPRSGCYVKYCMKPRSGCYVKYCPDNFFPVSDRQMNSIIPANPAVLHNDNIPFSTVSSMLRKVILDRGERILMRSPMGGCTELRDAICRYLARCRNINVSSEQIIIGSGAEYLYGLCIQMLGRDNMIALGQR